MTPIEKLIDTSLIITGYLNHINADRLLTAVNEVKESLKTNPQITDRQIELINSLNDTLLHPQNYRVIRDELSELYGSIPYLKTVSNNKDQEMSKRFPDDNDTTPRVSITGKVKDFVETLDSFSKHIKDNAIPNISSANIHCESKYTEGLVTHTITCTHLPSIPKSDPVTVVLKRVGNTLIYNGKLVQCNLEVGKPDNVFDFTIDNQRNRDASHIILYVNEKPVIDRPVSKVIGSGVWDNGIQEMTRIVKQIYKFDIEIILGK